MKSCPGDVGIYFEPWVIISCVSDDEGSDIVFLTADGLQRETIRYAPIDVSALSDVMKYD